MRKTHKGMHASLGASVTAGAAVLALVLSPVSAAYLFQASVVGQAFGNSTSSQAPSQQKMAKMFASEKTKADKAAKALGAFNAVACTFVDDSAPTKKEVSACKKEATKVGRVATSLRGLPLGDIDGAEDFISAVNDCKHGDCGALADAVSTFSEGLTSFSDDRQSMIDEANDTSADASMDFGMDPSMSGGQDMNSQFAMPTKGQNAIIDPLFNKENSSTAFPSAATMGSTSFGPQGMSGTNSFGPQGSTGMNSFGPQGMSGTMNNSSMGTMSGSMGNMNTNKGGNMNTQGMQKPGSTGSTSFGPQGSMGGQMNMGGNMNTQGMQKPGSTGSTSFGPQGSMGGQMNMGGMTGGSSMGGQMNMQQGGNMQQPQGGNMGGQTMGGSQPQGGSSSGGMMPPPPSGGSQGGNMGGGSQPQGQPQGGQPPAGGMMQ